MSPYLFHLREKSSKFQQLQMKFKFLNGEILIQNILEIIQELLLIEDGVEGDQGLLQTQIHIRVQISVTNWILEDYVIDPRFILLHLNLYDRLNIINHVADIMFNQQLRYTFEILLIIVESIYVGSQVSLQRPHRSTLR